MVGLCPWSSIICLFTRPLFSKTSFVYLSPHMDVSNSLAGEKPLECLFSERSRMLRYSRVRRVVYSRPRAFSVWAEHGGTGRNRGAVAQGVLVTALKTRVSTVFVPLV